jgi:hypothetical protein
MAAAWLRHGGVETTHLTHILTFLGLEMIPASVHQGVSPLGASVLTSIDGSGNFDPAVSLGIENDEPGMKSARLILRRALDLAKLMRKSSGINMMICPLLPYLMKL